MKELKQEKTLDALIDEAISIHTEANDQLSDWAVSYIGHQRARLREDIGIVGKICPENGIVVDLGSAPFYTPYALKKQGLNVKCVDIAPERFETFLSTAGLDFYKCDFEVERLPFDDNSVDVVILSEVFEHMRFNLNTTFKEFRRVLKPGGKLFLSTPNFLSIERVRCLVLSRTTANIFSEYDKIEKFGHMGHVREYTSKDVEIFLKAVGFSPEKTVFRGGTRPSSILSRVRAMLQKMIPGLRPWFAIISVKVD